MRRVARAVVAVLLILNSTLVTSRLIAGAQERYNAANGLEGAAWSQPAMKNGLARALTPSSGLMHYPVISRTHVAFVYGDQIWVAPRSGGVAAKLTDTPGPKYRLAFSPDGRAIAFSANLDGNPNLYTIPLEGGPPSRVTHLPSNVNLCQWASARDELLFYTNSLSFSRLAMQLFTVRANGGLPIKLPIPYGSEGALSPDGEWLAYTPYWPQTNLRQPRKHYLGGIAPDIWLFNLRTHTSKKITAWPGTDTMPMWLGKTIYYLSDAGPEHRLNVWSYDTASGTRKQITDLRDYDVNRPSLSVHGSGEIIFQYGPELRLLDIATGTTRLVEMTLPAEAPSPKSQAVDASKFITNSELSPGGDKALLGARGDVWVVTVGSSGNAPKNITRTSGTFERDPSWSPDGRYIAYFSDATGEYELYVAPSDGEGEAQRITRLGQGFRYAPQWSPDSGRIAFTDAAGRIFVSTLATRETKQLDADAWSQQSQMAWSHDSAWLAYTKLGDNRLSAVWLYNTVSGEKRQVSSGMYNEASPVFDRRGDYLFFISNRNISSPAFDPLNRTFTYTDTGSIIAVPLRDEVPSPLLPRRERSPEGVEGERQNRGEPKPLAIELNGLGRRAVVLPLSRANIFNLGVTATGNPIYSQTTNGGESSIRIFDLSGEKIEERVLLEGVTDFQLAADGRKALVRKMNALSVIDAAPEQKATAQVSTAGMSVLIDLRSEWRQIFDDTWRLFRDFFYAPDMHGADWPLMRERYRRLLDLCVTREDVNYVLSELIAEVNAGHAWIANPGDVTRRPEGPSAMLGADFNVENGAYRIVRLYEGAPWEDAARNPLSQAGVHEGDYLLAVNGTPLDMSQDPWAALQKTANTPVKLTISGKPIRDASAREIVVKPLSSDSDLRHAAWVERNRALVERLTNGQVGYLHIQDFTFNGLSQFVRQFQGQINKKALIIDPRWSQGGSVGDLLVRLLNQPPLNYYGERYSANNWPVPARAHQGPKCVLINHLVVSAGENFSYYFRKSGLGKLVGTRTWGGLVGLNGNPALIDGGYVNIPNAPFFSDEGEWLVENYGIEPDVEVIDDPALMADDRDPQLEAAIGLMLEELKRNPPKSPRRPPYTNRSMMNNRPQKK